MTTEKKPGHLLALVSRAHHNLANRIFGQIDLPRGQPAVLFELGHQDGITQSDLAKKVELSEASMTNMLQRMETSGLVRRQRDQSDARFSRIYLTETGSSTLAKARELAEKMDEMTFAGFTPEEQALMVSFLERVYKNTAPE